MTKRRGNVWRVMGFLGLAACNAPPAQPRAGGVTCTPTSTNASGGGCRIDFGCSDGVRRAAVCAGADCACLATDAVVARFPMGDFCTLAMDPQVAAVADRCVAAWMAALGGTTPDASVPDGGADASEDAAMNRDAADAPDVPGERFTEHGSAASPASCAALCMSAGARCAVCPGQTMNGSANYTRRESMGSQSQSRPIESCDTVVPARVDATFGDPFLLDDYYCCCEGQPVTRVDDDVANPRACDAVCMERGLRCSETTHWFSGVGGSEESHSNGGTTRTEVGSCSRVPPLTRTVSGRVYALSAHHCGCR